MAVKPKRHRIGLFAVMMLCFLASGCENEGQPRTEPLSDSELENLIKRSWQYVAMFNVNNKAALQYGGWNRCHVDTALKDHTLKVIARPNNDSLYITCLLDLRGEPVILDMPAFDSKYVSLMVTGYDHYVNIPLSTRQGNFRQPEKLLLHSARTEGYQKGEKIEGVDRYFEICGDFVSVVFRVMPHANEPQRFSRIKDQMQSVKLLTLSELRGGSAKPIEPVDFPAVGKHDVDIFGNNLLPVMQFVFNHSTFFSGSDVDQQVLAAYQQLGVAPGREYDPDRVYRLDGARLRQMAERIEIEEMSKAPWLAASTGLFRPKGQIGLDLLLFQSIYGPIGQPAVEAMYPAISSNDGRPMNAQHDYVIIMSADQLPPAQAFWSLTLYDTENGFFIQNERKKYSVGENGGMKLDDEGGIAIYVSAEKPEGVPPENWLPLNRGDYDIDLVMRVYVPNLEQYKNWEPPQAKLL